MFISREDGVRKVEYRRFAIVLLVIAGVWSGAAKAVTDPGDRLQYLQNQGDYGAAFEELYRSLMRAEQTGDSLQVGWLNLRIGELYHDLGDNESALWYFREAEKAARVNDDSDLVRQTLLLLGMSHLEQSDYDQAGAYLQEMKEIAESPVEHIRVDYHLARLEMAVGSTSQAGVRFTEALEQSRRIDFVEGEYFNALGMGLLERDLGRYQNAVSWFESALESSRKLDSLVFTERVLEKIYQTYREFGEPGEALNALEAVLEHRDRVTDLERERVRAEYETRLDIRRQEQQNQLLMARQSEQDARLRLQQAIGIGGLALMFGLLFMSVVLYRNNRSRERMNRQLKRSNQELDQLNRVKSRLFSVISHDLKGPIHSLQGFIQLAREKRMKKEELSGLFDKLEQEVDSSRSVLENLLAWSRSQMDGIQVESEEVDLKDEVERLFSHMKGRATFKGVRLEHNIAEKMKLHSDREMIRLLLRNCLSNGIKFSEHGGQVSVHARREGDRLRIWIRDQGVGMPPGTVDRLSNGEVHTSRGTAREKGSGLGLQLCREFAARLEGEMGIESLEGEGSTFWFLLPDMKE